MSSRSNSANPPSTVSMRRPCGVMVSVQLSLRGAEAGALLSDRIQDIGQVARQAHQPIQPRDGQHAHSRRGRVKTIWLVAGAGIEPATYGLRFRRSDQLSYPA